jgi:AraC-like DNA-binding protein
MRYVTDQSNDIRRFRYWQEIVRDVFIDLDCSRSMRNPFRGAVERIDLSPYRASLVSCVAHKVERTRSSISRNPSEFLLISLQTAGTGVLVQNDREAALDPGEVVLYESTRPFQWNYQSEFEQIVLMIPHADVVRQVGPPERFTAVNLNKISTLGELAARFIQQSFPLMRSSDPALARKLMGIAMELIGVAVTNAAHTKIDPAGNKTALILRAKETIRQNLGNPHLSPTGIASEMRISVRYLQDLFHETGETVTCWIWRQRLEECRRRLSDVLFAGCTISEIAFDWGFNDLSHFCHRFKQAYEMSPSEYRACHLRTLPNGRANTKRQEASSA